MSERLTPDEPPSVFDRTWDCPRDRYDPVIECVIRCCGWMEPLGTADDCLWECVVCDGYGSLSFDDDGGARMVECEGPEGGECRNA